MSVTTGSLGTADVPASNPSLHGLDRVNFFLAAMLAGFGPYIAAYLANENWPQAEIGLVLSAGSVAALLSQLPGGELLDKARSKRAVIAVGTGIVIVSALILAFWPRLPFVFIGLVLQGVTGGFLGPAIAAISLGLVGHSALAERLGRNQRFASTGALVGAALMGITGYLPQAWAAGSAFMLTQAMLGFMPDAPHNKLYVDPWLPGWLPDLTIQDVRIGRHKLTLRFWLKAGETHFEVINGDPNIVERREFQSNFAAWTELAESLHQGQI